MGRYLNGEDDLRRARCMYRTITMYSIARGQAHVQYCTRGRARARVESEFKEYTSNSPPARLKLRRRTATTISACIAVFRSLLMLSYAERLSTRRGIASFSRDRCSQDSWCSAADNVWHESGATLRVRGSNRMNRISLERTRQQVIVSEWCLRRRTGRDAIPEKDPGDLSRHWPTPSSSRGAAWVSADTGHLASVSSPSTNSIRRKLLLFSWEPETRVCVRKVYVCS